MSRSLLDQPSRWFLLLLLIASLSPLISAQDDQLMDMMILEQNALPLSSVAKNQKMAESYESETESASSSSTSLTAAGLTSTTAEPDEAPILRIIAIGDLNGDMEKTIKLLYSSGVIDDKIHWIGTAGTILVQTGNQVGPDELDKASMMVISLFRRLEEQAEQSQGRVVSLLGPNELEALDSEYCNAPTWHGDMSLAFMRRRACDSLRNRKPFANIYGTLFAHGGISPDWALYLEDSRVAMPAWNHAVTRYQDLPVFSSDGPVFYDDYEALNDDEVCDDIQLSLQRANARRMVVGNPSGQIRRRCGGKLWQLERYSPEYRLAYLEIASNLPSDDNHNNDDDDDDFVVDDALYMALYSDHEVIMSKDGYSSGQPHKRLYSNYQPRPVELVPEEEVPTQPPAYEEAVPLHKRINDQTRIVAVGDLHGDLEQTTSLLMMMGIIDLNDNWAAGSNVVLVQTGDITDRGPNPYEIFMLFMKLKKQAAEVGSEVIVLLGNHELMNLMGNTYYVHGDEYNFFIDDDTRNHFFSDRATLGIFLRSLPLVVRVGDTVFVHGGVSTIFSSWGEDEINQLAREALQNSSPHELSENVLFGDDGPLWFRGYASLKNPEERVCPELALALQHLGGKRMVVGHTMTRDGRILSRCNGMLAVIDVGISRYQAGKAASLAALEIIGDTVKAVYPNGEERILPNGKFPQVHSSKFRF